MPTGYTSDLYEGKPQTFPQFVMDCARAFGALITMRDEARGTPIPEEFLPSDYHLKAAAEAREEWLRLTSMSVQEAIAESHAEYDRYMQRRREDEQKREALKQRYGAMLAEVDKWNPPTPDHMGLKKFMQEQLVESIKFDCGTDYYPKPPPLGDEWRKQAIAMAERNVKYHEEEYVKEAERCQARTDWVRSLRESLPD